MKNAVLFRSDGSPEMEEEFNICGQYFQTFRYRTEIKEDTLVVGRYGVLPYYHELEKELKISKSRLINSYAGHEIIASGSWVRYIDCLPLGKEFQPFTVLMDFNVGHNLNTLPDDMSFVVKGFTTSKKFQWNTHCFAKNKEDLKLVVSRLRDDDYIQQQGGLMIREYVPLRKLEEGINGLNFSNEWRLFFYKGRLLSKGFYWTNAEFADDYNTDEYAPPKEVLDQVGQLACEFNDCYANPPDFFVFDIAERECGGWLLVDVNDGQCSGLSANDPHELYSNLSKALHGETA